MSELRRFVPGEAPCDVAVLIVTYNNEDDILALIDDVRRTAGELTIRVVVVDNDSSDETMRRIERQADDVVAIANPRGNAGYAGGVNEAMRHAGDGRYLLVANPDLRIPPDTLAILIRELEATAGGAVVPRIDTEDGSLYPSLRQEPSVTRALGDALVGSRFAGRPAWLREGAYSRDEYAEPRVVDWATGAVMLVRSEVARAVGAWDTRFFLYSEEVDFCRRLRELGWTIQYTPHARAVHRGGGSGRSAGLDALMAVNKVRYVEKWHRRSYARVFRGALALGAGLRLREPGAALILRALTDRDSWRDLPGPMPRRRRLPERSGAVIVPAHDEESTIAATLAGLSGAAVRGAIELVVVCNGCSDRTAEIAASVPGATVVEISVASKTAALNEGNAAATLWPRLYLDADVAISETAVLETFSALEGTVVAARPVSRVDSAASSRPVRRFYRARARVASLNTVLWGAGAYALSAAGARQAGPFPDVIADDLWIDLQFGVGQTAVVATDPVVVRAPRTTRHLVRTLKRVYRGKRELPAAAPAGRTAGGILRAVDGPRSALDAVTCVTIVLAARFRVHSGDGVWERDESNRRSVAARS